MVGCRTLRYAGGITSTQNMNLRTGILMGLATFRGFCNRGWPPYNFFLKRGSNCTEILSIPLGLSRAKNWREKLFLGLVQIEINLSALLSFCTKPRKSFSRQIFSRDGGGTNQVHPKTLLRERGFRLGVLIASCTANSNLEYKTPKRCVRHCPGPSQ